MAKFEGKPVNIVIILLYAPTSDHSDDEIEEPYADVKEALKQVYPHRDILIEIRMQKLAKRNMVA